MLFGFKLEEQGVRERIRAGKNPTLSPKLLGNKRD